MAAVNADGVHGRWKYSVCRQLDEVSAEIDEALSEV